MIDWNKLEPFHQHFLCKDRLALQTFETTWLVKTEPISREVGTTL